MIVKNKKKEIQFIGDDGYEKSMKQSKKVQSIMKFCEENGMNLMGFVDKDNDKALEKGMKQVVDNLVKKNRGSNR